MLSFCINNISFSLEFMHSNNRFRNNPENIFKDCDSIKTWVRISLLILR